MPVLGFHLIQPRPKIESIVESDVTRSPFFVIDNGGVNARMQVIDGEFVVQKNSTARRAAAPSWTAFRGSVTS